jgi:hypothetical protein
MSQSDGRRAEQLVEMVERVLRKHDPLFVGTFHLQSLEERADWVGPQHFCMESCARWWSLQHSLMPLGL